MKRILLAALITSFAVGSAMAQSCAVKAVDKTVSLSQALPRQVL